MSYDKPEGNAEKFTKPAPPKLDVELQQVLHRHKGRHPRMFPANNFEASDLWISMQEPAKERDRPEWISQSTKAEPNLGSWSCPYIERVRYNLRIFLALSGKDQDFVAEMIRAGYPWRGDQLDFYREVIKNTDIMHGYVDKHGRDADGLLPKEYTTMILGQQFKVGQDWDSNLPYNKSERDPLAHKRNRTIPDE